MSFGWHFSMKPIGAYVPPVPPTDIPANVIPPRIDGLARVEQTLTAYRGRWTQSPTSYGFVWLADGSPIAGATGSTLVLSDAQVGKAITVSVTAANGLGSASAVSAATDPVAVKPITEKPVNLTRPQALLSASSVSTSDGTWSNSPTSITYQWYRNSAGISGATSSTYVFGDADWGKRFYCEVSATNAIGTTTAQTNEVGPVSQALPVVITAPSITGSAEVGQLLTADNGEWQNSPTHFDYIWTRNGTPIANETENTYTLVQADAGAMIGLTVTATNFGGSTSADAEPIGPVGVVASSINIVAEGDSLTIAAFASDPDAYAYPELGVAALPPGPTYQLRNIGSAGIEAAQIDDSFDSRGGDSYDATKDVNVFTIMAGTNDFGDNRTDLQVYHSLRRTLRKAKLAGYQRRAIGTLISRNDAFAFDADTRPINQYIRENYNSDLDVDAVFDFAAISQFEEAADADDPTYYNGDKLHLTDTGYTLMGQAFAPILNEIITAAGTRVKGPATWAPLDISDNLTLTNGNRTLLWKEPGFSQASARGYIGKESGKWYWETVIDNSHYTAVGIMSDEFEQNIWDNYNGPQNDPNAMAYGQFTNALTYNGDNILTLGKDLEDGDIVRIAIDVDAKRFWISINDGEWNGGFGGSGPTIDPATGVGGVDFSGFGPGRIYPVAWIFQDGGQITSNFDAGQNVKPIPSGFQMIGA